MEISFDIESEWFSFLLKGISHNGNAKYLKKRIFCIWNQTNLILKIDTDFGASSGH